MSGGCKSVGVLRAVALLRLVLIAAFCFGAAGAAPAGAAPQADVGPGAPENLRCPGQPAPPPPPSPGPGYTVTPVWAWQNVIQLDGPQGISDGPYAVTQDRQCNIYVTDSLHFRVLKLGPDGHQIGQWSLPGQRSPGESSSPHGVAVDSQGYVYVTDTPRDRVYKVSPQGQLAATFGDCPTGGSACDPKLPGRFISPEGIAVDGAGNVYVAEVAGLRLQKLSSTGKSLGVWNLNDKGLGDQLIPSSLSIDQSGFVYMAEASNDWIVKFDPNTGAVVGKWGGQRGGEPGQFHGPLGVGVDAAGNMYVSDAGNWRVQELGSDGRLKAQWRNCLDGDPPCQFPDAGADPGQFMESRGISVDGQGAVYVADTDNQRIQRLIIVNWTITPPLTPVPNTNTNTGTNTTMPDSGASTDSSGSGGSGDSSDSTAP